MSNRTPAVDEFMRTLDHAHKADIERLRMIILAADPCVTEAIKWKAPTFGYDGEDRITFHLRAKVGLALILHRGAKPKDATDFTFEDPDGLLEWPAKDRAILKIRDLDAQLAAIASLLRRWMEHTAT